MSDSDPLTLSSHTKADVAFSLVQLHGANLSPDQPSQDVQLLEREQQAAQQLCQQCSLQQEEGRRQLVSGNKSPEVPADGNRRGGEGGKAWFGENGEKRSWVVGHSA